MAQLDAQADRVTARLFDATQCSLGEGPLWHPKRCALFWFDIVGKRLLMRSASEFRQWLFDDIVSAAGWVDEHTLLIASEKAFLRFDIKTGQTEPIIALEADNPNTRSNDGRADPWGGFWIGTMGKQAQSGAGSIYRFYQGQVTKLYSDITISNAIAFAPDRKSATFTDTTTGQVMRTQLAPGDGMPVGDPEVFLDFRADGINPDGAVFDADGNLWVAQWGASRVACYGSDGTFLRAVHAPTPHTTCPAFGGKDLQTLFMTTAQEGLGPSNAGFAHAGQTFCLPLGVQGQAEHQVKLSS